MSYNDVPPLAVLDPRLSKRRVVDMDLGRSTIPRCAAGEVDVGERRGSAGRNAGWNDAALRGSTGSFPSSSILQGLAGIRFIHER